MWDQNTRWAISMTISAFWFYHLFQVIGIGSGANNSTGSIRWILNPQIRLNCSLRCGENHSTRSRSQQRSCFHSVRYAVFLIRRRDRRFNHSYRISVEAIDRGSRTGSWRCWRTPDDRRNTWWCRRVSGIFSITKKKKETFLFLGRVDHQLNCVKGGGACHLREKVLAEAANTCVFFFLFILNNFLLLNPFH